MVRTGQDGPKGYFDRLCRRRNTRPQLWCAGTKDGLEKPTHRAGPVRRLQNSSSDNLVGVEGDGFKYAMKGLDGGRLNIASCSLGAAQAGLDMTLQYMSERKAFGQSIDQFQALAIPSCGYGDRTAGRPHFSAPSGLETGSRRSGCDQILRHGQEIRDRDRIEGGRSVPATARWLRLSGRLRHRKACA